AGGGNPVIPLVRALTAAVPGHAAGWVHWGATSQDILDSAAMLAARRALGPLLDDLDGAADAAARLASEHRGTLMAGRTLLQQALPITFGFKAAGWLVGLDQAATRLDQIRQTRLAVQLGGAAGTLASLGDDGLCVLAGLAEELDLAEPLMAWHTERGRIIELAAGLGQVAAALGKIAGDVVLLASTEVAEVSEGGPPGHGGSSTLPHKANPVAAVSARACAAQAPGLVATLLVAASHSEHERAAGAWHAEWAPLRELLRAVGSAAAWLRDCLEHLQVDEARMAANMDLLDGLLLSERVGAALSPALGRLAAHDVMQRCAAKAVGGGSLGDVLAADSEVSRHLSPDEIERLLDPSGYLGSADAFVDRALRRPARGARTEAASR
ncbi:MAG: lyase family protein, partial [Actinomycetota bacterium]|nr:lyase family protein [Actinomycetota bacterium]